MFEKSNPIAKKYALIDLAGRGAINERNIQEFAGFSEDLKKNFTGVMEFTPESQQVVQKRILSRIQEIGTECGIGLLLAGRDYPLHATILEGRLQEDLGDVGLRDEAFTSIGESEGFKQAVVQLEGLNLEYKYLLIDKGNILLTAIDIPDQIVKAREALADVYKEQGLAPRPMDNILHISLARIAKIPKGENATELLKKYKEEMIKLRHLVSADPLMLRVFSISSGSSFEILTHV